MDAIALLKADHNVVSELFDLYNGVDSFPRQKELVERLCTELVVHMAVEEELFYPAVQRVVNEALVTDAKAQHRAIKDLITRIQQSGSTNQHVDTQVQLLAEVIRHHVNEEHNVLFPKVQSTSIDLVALGAAIAQRQEQLLSVGNAQ
jgi:hemerythrin superfamily protein